MSRQRAGVRLLPLAAACAAPVLYVLWIRPRMLSWGATGEELRTAYAGDDLIADRDDGATMATTLSAPPERVWPWLAQMGGDRGGWYGWDWLDNKGKPSADHIVAEWQRLEAGQHLQATSAPGVQDPNWFTVAIVEPNRTLVLESSYSLPSGQGFDPRSGPIPRAYVHGLWGFHLRPTPDGRTRLITRTRGRNRPRALTGILSALVFEPMHFLMQTRQFHNLGRRVGADI